MATITGIPGYTQTRGPSMRADVGVPQATGETFGAGKFNDIYNLAKAGEKFFNTQMGMAIDRDHQRQSDEATEKTLEYQIAATRKKLELAQKEGSNALKVDEEFAEWDSANRPRFGQNVQGGLAGRLYKQHTDSIYAQGTAQMNQHKLQQEKALTYANIDKMKGEILSDVEGNPVSFAMNLAKLNYAIGNEAEIKGWDPQYRKFQLDNAIISLGQAAIKAALVDPRLGPVGAQQMIERDPAWQEMAEVLGPSRMAAAFGATVQNVRIKADKAMVNRLNDDIYQTSRRMKITNPTVTESDIVEYIRAQPNYQNEILRELGIDGVQDAVSRYFNIQLRDWSFTAQERAQLVQDTEDSTRRALALGASEESFRAILANPNLDPARREGIEKGIVADTTASQQNRAAISERDKTFFNDALLNNRDELYDSLRTGGIKSWQRSLEKILGDEIRNPAIMASYQDESARMSTGRYAAETAAQQYKNNRDQLEIQTNAINNAKRGIAAVNAFNKNMATPGYYSSDEFQRRLNNPLDTEDRQLAHEELALWNNQTATIKTYNLERWDNMMGMYLAFPEMVADRLSSSAGRLQLIADVGNSNFTALSDMHAKNTADSDKNKSLTSIMSELENRIKSGYADYETNPLEADQRIRTANGRAYSLFAPLLDKYGSYDNIPAAEKNVVLDDLITGSWVESARRKNEKLDINRDVPISLEDLKVLNPVLADNVILSEHVKYDIVNQDVKNALVEAYNAERLKIFGGGGMGGPVVDPVKRNEFGEMIKGTSQTEQVIDWLNGKFSGYISSPREIVGDLVDRVEFGDIPIGPADPNIVIRGNYTTGRTVYITNLNVNQRTVQDSAPYLKDFLARPENAEWRDAKVDRNLSTGALELSYINEYGKTVRKLLDRYGEPINVSR